MLTATCRECRAEFEAPDPIVATIGDRTFTLPAKQYCDACCRRADKARVEAEFEVAVTRSGLPGDRVDAAKSFRGKPLRPLTPIIQHVQAGGWVCLQGPTGTGKTVLAVQIALGAIRRGIGCRFATESGLIRAYMADDEDFGRIAKAHLLVIDEVGGHKSATILEGVVNERYGRKLPTVVTTNLSLDDLAGSEEYRRIVSRLRGLCPAGSVGAVVLDGPDLRAAGEVA